MAFLNLIKCIPMTLMLFCVSTPSTMAQDNMVLQKRIESLEARVSYLENKLSSISDEVSLIKRGGGGGSTTVAPVLPPPAVQQQAPRVKSESTTVPADEGTEKLKSKEEELQGLMED